MNQKQEYGERLVSELKQHPQNPRRGNVEAIRESIESSGFFGAVIVQKSSGFILAGNHRAQAAKAAGIKKVPIIEIDCDDQTALKILLSDNRAAEGGEWDVESLLDSIKQIDEKYLDGIGFDEDYLADLYEFKDHPFKTERISIEKLSPHPRNYQEHPQDQLDQIIDSIKTHGFYRNIIVAEDNTILAGHGVVLAATQMGKKRVPVIRLNVAPDDARALKVLTSDNEINNLAVVNDRALTEMLREIMQTTEGLGGTGFTGEQLAALTLVTRDAGEISNKNAAAEWLGMPEFEPMEDQPRLMITFENEEDRDTLMELIGNSIIIKRVGQSWTIKWPEKARDDLSSVRFE